MLKNGNGNAPKKLENVENRMTEANLVILNQIPRLWYITFIPIPQKWNQVQVID